MNVRAMGRADGVKTYAGKLLAKNCLNRGNRYASRVRPTRCEESRIRGLNLSLDDSGSIASRVGKERIGTTSCCRGVRRTEILVVDSLAFSELQAVAFFDKCSHRSKVVDDEQVQDVIADTF